jgi:hypothetical protein
MILILPNGPWMTLVPHITPRFPVSRRYISEVPAMGEPTIYRRLNASGAQGEIIFAIYTLSSCAYFKLEALAAENEEGKCG